MTASACKAAALGRGLVAGLLLGGCRTPSAPPAHAPIEPLAVRPAMMPSDGDLAAADLAMAVMTTDRLAGLQALGRIQAYEATLTEDDRESGLAGYGQYALASVLDDAEAFEHAMKNLLDSKDLDPGLEKVVEQYRDDQPLKLARARIRDAWVRHFGTIFNYFSAPVGKSVATGAVAFAGLARSFFRVLVYEFERPAMDPAERQALEQWKTFVERNPDSATAPEVVAQIEKNQRKWNELQRDRFLQAGKKALEHDQPRIALVMAERALQYRPEDPQASRLRQEALAGVERWNEARVSTEAAPGEGDWRQDDVDVAPPEARDLTLALVGVGDPAAEAEALFLSDPGGPLADEARFVMAFARGENGNPEAMWEYMTAIGMVDPAQSNVSRHAEASVLSAEQNPHRAFRLSRREDRKNQGKWIFFGAMGGGPKDRGLPRPLEWLVDLPTLAESIMALPNRLVAFPWISPWPFGEAPATYARQYLERYPDGRRFDDVASWLQGWEERRSNYVAAFNVALLRSDIGDGDLLDLEEKAAQQMLDAAGREHRADTRLLILEGIARDHSDTKAGRKAGREARELAELYTPQRITLSRGFLEEHLFLIGPDGIGLDPIYLDGNTRNGELHPYGVALVSGRTLELSFLAASGDAKDEPERRYQTISVERMSRLVSLLDETSLRLAQLETDYQPTPNADRDTFFETARFGVGAGPGVKPAARSQYSYTGMRETYGLVRSRDSILPFELVVQGSLYDFGFGVFPRIRMPRPTPDAFLYK